MDLNVLVNSPGWLIWQNKLRQPIFLIFPNKPALARRLLVLVYFTFDFFTVGKKTNGNILNESSMPAFAGSSVAMPAVLERKNPLQQQTSEFWPVKRTSLETYFRS